MKTQPIFSGYAPLGARKERLEDVHLQHLHGIDCEGIQISHTDNTARLSGVIIRPEGQTEPPRIVSLLNIILRTGKLLNNTSKGNAGNPLHRLPVFQALLRATSTGNLHTPTAVLAVAPRSYWTSTPRRPTQDGLIADYIAALGYAQLRFPGARTILYGHSLGGAVALCMLDHLSSPAVSKQTRELDTSCASIAGLILENPLSSVPDMLPALYPPRWVPYRHLRPFVWDRWDALGAVEAAVATPGENISPLVRLSRKMLVLVSENDEVVPRTMGAQIVKAAAERDVQSGAGDPVRGPQLVVIRGALHENAWDRYGWAEAVRAYVRRVVEEGE
ncbi:hypothetical protein H0H81_010540 [Sphagnurus paluster]|uniref:AB hydrolase-1 domain-containing protein n=1 Tax=Sphagnurus paluster TaxID=117069 RepID=A0A9P7K7B8_9AGAR|nr:hypothetical protein H0H81_010540 [Sphagnurus paluster]